MSGIVWSGRLVPHAGL